MLHNLQQKAAKQQSDGPAARSSSRTRQAAASEPDDSAEDFSHLYAHTLPAHRRYLNNEGLGFGSVEQRQRQYNIHKLERAFDRVAEYRADKLFNRSQAEFERERRQRGRASEGKGGGVTEEEERVHEVAMVSMAQQRKARRRVEAARQVEEQIDAAMVEWASEASKLSAFGRPFTAAELMMGVNSSADILTQRMHRIMKDAGYVPEWLELEGSITERYDTAVRELTERWHSNREAHRLHSALHADAAPQPADHPRFLDYAGHFRPVQDSRPSELYGERWRLQAAEFTLEIKSINASVMRFNMMVPITSKQRVLYLSNNVIQHLQRFPPDLRRVEEEDTGPRQFSHGRVSGGRLTASLLAAIVAPIVGVLGSMGWLVFRHRRRLRAPARG